MDCDRSAYFQRAIKATARRLKNKYSLAVFFLLFGRLELETYGDLGFYSLTKFIFVVFEYAIQSLATTTSQIAKI